MRSGGTVTKAARGVVRVQLAYEVGGRAVTHTYRAPIRNGRWQLNAALSSKVRSELDRRSGGVIASLTYEGSAKIGGEMRSYDMLGAR